MTKISIRGFWISKLYNAYVNYKSLYLTDKDCREILELIDTETRLSTQAQDKPKSPNKRKAMKQIWHNAKGKYSVRNCNEIYYVQ